MQGPTHRTSSWSSSCFFLGTRVREVFSRGGRKTFLSALLRFIGAGLQECTCRRAGLQLKVVRVRWHGWCGASVRAAELRSLGVLRGAAGRGGATTRNMSRFSGGERDGTALRMFKEKRTSTILSLILSALCHSLIPYDPL